MENVNSVCFAAKITEIRPIEGADKIELAIVGGWNCITQKGQYRVDDLVVVATTDAVIPQKLSDALNVTSYLRKGQRVRTVKLRGVYSECLIIPISLIPEKYRYDGSDCMELMEIFKYEPPVKMVQLASGRKIRYQDNPNFHVYYKFPNLKNVPDMFNENDIVEITRKIHGTNARYGIVKKKKLTLLDRIKLGLAFINKDWRYSDYEFVVGSHNVEKGSDSQGFYDVNVWYEIEKKYKIKKKLWNWMKSSVLAKSVGSGITIYGEIYGPGIQKGYDYGETELKFFMFDMTVDGRYIFPYFTHLSADTIFELPYAEVLYEGNWNQKIQDSFVFNNFIKGSNIPHEGIVIKHISGAREKVGKCINPDYLIYSEKHNVGDSH